MYCYTTALQLCSRGDLVLQTQQEETSHGTDRFQLVLLSECTSAPTASFFQVRAIFDGSMRDLNTWRLLEQQGGELDITRQWETGSWQGRQAAALCICHLHAHLEWRVWGGWSVHH